METSQQASGNSIIEGRFLAYLTSGEKENHIKYKTRLIMKDLTEE